MKEVNAIVNIEMKYQKKILFFFYKKSKKDIRDKEGSLSFFVNLPNTLLSAL